MKRYLFFSYSSAVLVTFSFSYSLKQEPLSLKDLEKIAPKEKSIPMQTVKDVLNSLVSDDMVDTDKIGTSVYFWSFPSKSSTIVSAIWSSLLPNDSYTVVFFRNQTKSKN